MTTDWSSQDTTTHQDHVIAHVVGATILGYFIHDEALYILLDIGFIWRIYLDGEMGLLPHPVATGELDADAEYRSSIQADVDLLLREDPGTEGLRRIVPPPVKCLIEEVALYISGDQRRLLIAGEDGSLTVDTSVSSGDIKVSRYNSE